MFVELWKLRRQASDDGQRWNDVQPQSAFGCIFDDELCRVILGTAVPHCVLRCLGILFRVSFFHLEFGLVRGEMVGRTGDSTC
mmetsp:Transcript_7579/g.18754  ORF Transcript_7579/g.18754 Transcript_7579/m.18754 type:complete len:83 (+) Transcript_7579:265-513(+)